MAFSRKICLYTTFLGSIFCFNLHAHSDDLSAESNPAPLEKVASAIKNDVYLTLITRVAAKTAIELTAGKADAAKVFSGKTVGKEIANAALNEVAPLQKEANFIVKHADLVAPVLLANALDKKEISNLMNKETAIALLKKELGKGLFINPDFQKLETLNDALFFAADFGAEIALDDHGFNDSKEFNDGINPVTPAKARTLQNGLKKAISSKIITPLIMAKVGNDFARAIAKSKNKNVQKAISNLFEKLVVSTIVNAALNVKK